MPEIRMIILPFRLSYLFLYFDYFINLFFSLSCFGWIRSFSLPDFVVEVQNAVKPVLNAYMKVGNARIVTLHMFVYFSHGLFFITMIDFFIEITKALYH